jgi:hypothetical protein
MLPMYAQLVSVHYTMTILETPAGPQINREMQDRMKETPIRYIRYSPKEQQTQAVIKTNKLTCTTSSFSFNSEPCNFVRLCGLVVRVISYRSGDPGSIPGTTRKKVVGLEGGPISLVSTN